MEHQNHVKTVKLRGIDKTLLIGVLLALITLSSCDPSATLVVQNHTADQVMIVVKTQKSIDRFTDTYGVDSLFDKKVDYDLLKQPIPINRKDSLNYHFTIPAKSAFLIPPGTLGTRPPIEYVVLVVNNKSDTVYLYQRKLNIPGNFYLRPSGFMMSKWILDIR